MLTITITGMGQTFTAPIHIIKQALQTHGYNVTINDPHPLQLNIQDHIKRMVQLNKEGAERNITINCEHQPWGG